VKPVYTLLLSLVIIALSESGPASADPAFRSFDQTMESYMAKHQIPGGALAVVKDGRLVYARGYGLANRETREPVKATSLFRIASISKPFTAAALFTVLQKSRGRVSLDSKALSLLSPGTFPGAKNPADPRLKEITLRQILQHTAGWDKDALGIDPMFLSMEIAAEQGVTPPARQEAIISHMLKKPLDFDPGSRYSYSNFGYCLLGRVIESLSGTSYEDYGKKNVLLPMGIKNMCTGKSLPGGRVPGEVCYYESDEATAPTVFRDKTPPVVPRPYGSFCLEAMDSHGGWLASAVDLARFAAALDGQKGRELLSAQPPGAMYARPPAPAWILDDGSPSDYYYGCGWLVRPVGNGGKANYWHAGMLPGTYTLLVRRHDGLSWAVLFNECSLSNYVEYGEIDQALHQAAAGVTRWPGHDLFPGHL